MTPVLLGAILHLFLYQGETVTGLGPMMKSLWADGLLLKSGGAVAGGLAAGMKRLVGTMVSVIVLLLLLATALLAALRVSPRELVQRARDRVPYEPQPEPERPARTERPRRQRPGHRHRPGRQRRHFRGGYRHRHCAGAPEPGV